MSETRKFDLGGKTAGFYVTAIAAVLALVTAIVYQVSYSSNQYYSSAVFIAFLAALPAAAVLLLLRLDNFAPAALAAATGVGSLAFVYAMYYDVSVVLVGIDKNSFEPAFILCCVLMLASFILSEVALYLKKTE